MIQPRILVLAVCASGASLPGFGQLIDRTLAPNASNEGIAKSLSQQIGPGRGTVLVPYSSAYIINRDPFRAIRRGRQLFQRKFRRQDGEGPYLRDGSGDISNNLGIGAGSADSCAACHARPRGSAGAGGGVVTRPDSRDAPHLFGIGLKEILADEITAELRDQRERALSQARERSEPVMVELSSKGIRYGSITAMPNGRFDTSRVAGVDADLRVRPFFAHGGVTSIRELVINALNNEMGFQAHDPELSDASKGARAITPGGMVLDGKHDIVESPPEPDPGKFAAGAEPRNQIATAVVDYLEFYLLNYFKPALYEQTPESLHGRTVFDRIGCATCHVPDLSIDRDRRVADVETVYDQQNGIMNTLFSTATPLFRAVDDGTGMPALKVPAMQPFLVKNIFTDLKRHDLGPKFHERNYDGTLHREMLTAPLWGVATTAPYGHDGRSINLMEVILRHGGEAQEARDAFAAASSRDRNDLIAFLNTLVLFPPDDTASNLDPGDPTAVNFPQFRHGAIKLTVLFNDPTDIE
jgi:hypothetical protein